MNKTSSSKIRLGWIGFGHRGMSLLQLMLDMDDVDILAVCDLYEDRAQEAAELTAQAGRPRPDTYADYREVIARPDIDAIMITTYWSTHVEIAVASMKAGKPCAMEVGGATDLQECWDLVKTYEETGVPCMMLENCCYGRHEMAILNMVKQGVFGELIHCQGGYEHDLRDEVVMGDVNRHYRFQQYLHRNGELYPTHEVGPIAKYLDINKGNRFVSLTSMSSKARGAHEWIVNELGKDHPKAKLEFTQGDIVTTMIQCARGETVLLIHDTTLPRPYSRGGRVQGTKGLWMEDNNSIHIEGRSPAHEWEPFDAYLEEYEHPLWKEYIKMGVKEGHGGMDYLVLRAFIESLQENKLPPIDVYDAATWMAITVLSEQSIALGSAPQAFPDFTRGKWITPDPSPSSKYSLDRIDEELFSSEPSESITEKKETTS